MSVRLRIRVRGGETYTSTTLLSRVPAVGEQMLMRRVGKLPQSMTVTAVEHDDGTEDVDANVDVRLGVISASQLREESSS